ncbi:MAG: hypothetical protein BWK80_47585 [Desulfobacteraceae bacterium IS3]|nr:MAG: hypothetical protein BWK80_47585 [Desulfobacteraceae bacterium IS3]
MQKTRADYEQILLNEIREFPLSELPKAVRLFRFLKEEIFTHREDTEEDTRLFWESFGSWQDARPAEEIVKDIYAARTSSRREIEL